MKEFPSDWKEELGLFDSQGYLSSGKAWVRLASRVLKVLMKTGTKKSGAASPPYGERLFARRLAPV